MMNANGKRWLVDATLALGFLFAMELDLTGLEVHEWLSVGVGLLAGYHLLSHWPWVSLVTRRLFGKMSAGKTSAQARRFYVVDAALLAGFLTIGATGLAMSTWLGLPLANYFAWRDVHVVASVATLVLVALKVGLHWRWIVAMGPRITFGPAPANTGLASRPATASTRFGRRQFASAMAATGGLVLFSGGRALANTVFAPTSAAAAGSASESATTSPIAVALLAQTTEATPTRTTAGPTASTTSASTSANRPAATSTPVATVSTTSAAKATATTATPSQQSSGTQSCVYRCPKGLHCSYPGKCGRYVDTNKNGRCDLGECA